MRRKRRQLLRPPRRPLSPDGHRGASTRRTLPGRAISMAASSPWSIPSNSSTPKLYALHEAALHNDWSKVKPEIFGTLFQHSMETGKAGYARRAPRLRRALHQRVRHPESRRPHHRPPVARAHRRRRQKPRQTRATRSRDLRRFRVLDPACGSGNFLFVAYREMKRLERDSARRACATPAKARASRAAGISLTNSSASTCSPSPSSWPKSRSCSPRNSNSRSRRIWSDSDDLHIQEKPLPLDNLDSNILCTDALFTDWPKADAIIGNPPYLGSRYLAKEHGYDYANKVYARFPGVPKMADFCTHWFRLAHDRVATRRTRRPCRHATRSGKTKAARRASITSSKTAASSPKPSRTRFGAATQRCMSESSIG